MTAKRNRSSLARPITYGILAGILLLILICRPPEPEPVVHDTIEMDFSDYIDNPELDRTYVTETDTSEIVADIYVEPQDDHVYDFEIKPVDSAAVTYWNNYRDFNERGFATLKTRLASGKYIITMFDIVDSDTTRTTFRFTLKKESEY